ncbi:MAG: class IV adenylate cyclase [Bacteroidetes bacterium]|nr:MAG: class IV adenylate cyclase [Bacteroidota bacterium]
MQEIEVKILEIDRDEIEKKLLALGAEKYFEGEMRAVYYDAADGHIHQQGDALRLRKEGSKTVLTYKRAISRQGAKIMEECETEVASMENMQQILSLLGFKPLKETRKFRTSYLLEGCSVVIDEYTGALAHIPPFIEVEATELGRMQAVVKRLGYTPEACKSWSTYELVQHYQKN